MTGFNLYRLYRRAGNAPRTSLRMAITLLWRDLRTNIATGRFPVAKAPDPQRRPRLDHRADVERRARQRL
ncbi:MULTISPECIES: hypothetical protein [unclassified Acidovorax]|uniref:hypothetical protein n=1 Tax=unclassified Acidovorax TaxID=2684926 RepID=UPI001C459357|nr:MULTISPECIES: hypothetical protein [unclassified Acidovorax]MBV7428077.1 hypothetical protein [Acidovorax sp. sif0732]MBV7449334.1 hypothetical protein [Acidovorax sp. sif0715]